MNYGRPKIRDVILVAADLYERSEGELLHGRAGVVPKQRQAAMVAARIVTGASFPEIARVFGRDHSTVVFASQQADKDPLLMEDALTIAATFAAVRTPQPAGEMVERHRRLV